MLEFWSTLIGSPGWNESNRSGKWIGDNDGLQGVRLNNSWRPCYLFIDNTTKHDLAVQKERMKTCCFNVCLCIYYLVGMGTLYTKHLSFTTNLLMKYYSSYFTDNDTDSG